MPTQDGLVVIVFCFQVSGKKKRGCYRIAKNLWFLIQEISVVINLPHKDEIPSVQVLYHYNVIIESHSPLV